MKNFISHGKGFVFLTALFIVTFVNPCSYLYAQKVGALSMDASYTTSDDLSGITIGINSVSVDAYTGVGYKIGAFFGPGNGVYNGEFSSSYIQGEISKEMQGSSLSSYSTPDETDGGFVLGGKLLFTLYQNRDDLDIGYEFSLGLRLNYFTKQELSVKTVSTGGGYEYTEFIQLEYKDPVLVPGIEVNLSPGPSFLTFQYAYMFQGENLGAMHMFGVAMNMVIY